MTINKKEFWEKKIIDWEDIRYGRNIRCGSNTSLAQARGGAPRYTVPAAGNKKLAYVLIPKPLNRQQPRNVVTYKLAYLLIPKPLNAGVFVTSPNTQII